MSGNPLTAVLNSICNCINLRLAYYTIYKPDLENPKFEFRDFVSIIVYGDDNVGSSSKERPAFTIKNISKVMGDHRQVYTMVDKHSELVNFLPRKMWEFLKRDSVYHDALGCHVGALSATSISKSLHAYLDENDDLTVEMRQGMSIDNACREFWSHGPEIYEERRAQLRLLANVAGVTHLCCEIDKSYADRCVEWKEKYIPTYTHQSGVETSKPVLVRLGSKKKKLHEDVQISGEYGFEDPGFADEGVYLPHDREPEFLDLYVLAIRDIPMRLIAQEQPIISPMIGEVDLVFVCTVYGVHNFVFVEIKSGVSGTSARNKGRKQLRRVIEGMGYISPKSSHVGLLLDNSGYERVCVSGRPTTMPLDILPA